ncbi:MAG: nucleotide exchange factor GrpE [Candidatus Sungbacteria bacterium]|uniref:Protein GrpE n=1 Tax=Candidatus Sungiibacteriota bacterium TaxID=2750080 RepID=A0A9D6QYD4_9BACT|nr:nucleotide exchange factor GrpE [Candidatus Sungbacteria bacterium]
MDEPEIIEAELENGSPPDPIEKLNTLKEKLKAIEEEKKQYLEGWQRAKADLINSRRDEERKMSDWRGMIENQVILEFMPVLDSFEIALKHRHEPPMPEDSMRGFQLIYAQLLDTLRRLGVQPIKTKNEMFDPAFHEAIEEIETDAPSGRIIEEIQKGYRRGEVLLRPARVKVAK